MGDLVWDERLIGQAEAYQLAGDWPWRAGIRNGIAYLDCGKCGQAVLILGAASAPFTITTDAFVAAVLRHAVTAHDLILNRKNRGGSNGGHARAGRMDPEPGDLRTAESLEARPGRHRAPGPVGRNPGPGELLGPADRRRARHGDGGSR